MMKVYVILTYTIGGFSGGPAYVNNKILLLKERGWNVVVIDAHGGKNAPVVLDNLKHFEGNRFSKLFFPPSLFSLSQIRNIITKLSARVDRSAERIVVESNSIILSLWGELLAKELKARHLIYIIGENKKIDSQELFEFYKFKYDNNEIFSIKKEMFSLLFSSYMRVADAEEHYWSASCTIPPQNIDFPGLNAVESADYNIVIFSRYKRFFPLMITELCIFANYHKDKIINLIFFGVTALDSLKKELAEETNISCYYFASQVPVPKVLFRMADVVIAASGCANIAFRQGAKTISMDVVSLLPIGLMGYTTVSTCTAGDNDKEEQTLSQLLEELLVKHKFSGPCIMEKQYSDKGLSYQLTFADGPAHYWNGDVKKVKRNIKMSSTLLKFAFRLGLEPLISQFRYILFNLKSRGTL